MFAAFCFKSDVKLPSFKKAMASVTIVVVESFSSQLVLHTSCRTIRNPKNSSFSDIAMFVILTSISCSPSFKPNSTKCSMVFFSTAMNPAENSSESSLLS